MSGDLIWLGLVLFGGAVGLLIAWGPGSRRMPPAPPSQDHPPAAPPGRP